MLRSSSICSFASLQVAPVSHRTSTSAPLIIWTVMSTTGGPGELLTSDPPSSNGGGKGGAEQGTDPLTVEVPFMFTDILINGVSPISDTSVTAQVQ